MILPERFDLHYVAAGGQRVRPVMLHRALYGSIERFMAVLLEHHGVALPAWLAPVQAWVAPVGESAEVARASAALAARLAGAGVRVSIEGQSTSLARRVRDAHEHGVPWLLVVGAREAAAGTVNLRPVRGGDRPRERSCDAAVAELVSACAPTV
jgi:threonyl-tRNA synthetase